VHLFDLVDHPTAKRAYAWRARELFVTSRLVVVLGAEAVVDATSAVHAARSIDRVMRLHDSAQRRALKKLN